MHIEFCEGKYIFYEMSYWTVEEEMPRYLARAGCEDREGGGLDQVGIEKWIFVLAVF